MCSFYPRTVSLVVDAMHLYVESGHEELGGVEASKKAMERLGALVAEKLDEAAALPAVEVEGVERRVALERLLGM